LGDALSAAIQTLQEGWSEAWEESLKLWSGYVKLGAPRFCRTEEDERREGLTGSFAMIRLADHAVVVSLRQIQDYNLEDYAKEVLGHEIGHHVYCPGDLTDQARLLARIRRGIPMYEYHAPLIANLYADLFINDRLQRVRELRMDEVYRRLGKHEDRLWNLYMRIYELLWGLPRASLVHEAALDARNTGQSGRKTKAEIASDAARAYNETLLDLEADAELGRRLIRRYARDWLGGAGRFAALIYPYLLQENGQGIAKIAAPLLDATGAPGEGEFPSGLTSVEADELNGAVHPALDPELNGSEDLDALGDSGGDAEGDGADGESPDDAGGSGGSGQARQPFEYGEILRALGFELDDAEIARRYYREQALPYLVRYPERRMPQSSDPLPEGYEIWEPGAPAERIDWVATAMRSPIVIPGYTTVQQVYGVSEGGEPETEPVDLDLYVDCSGSMPDPRRVISYIALAGAVIALSALRNGAKVQATLWSGKKQFRKTEGFTDNEREVFEILTGYLGGGTAFPIHVLRDTFQDRKAHERRVHVLVLSDDGVSTMFAQDERGDSGWDVSAMALERGGAGGTLVLRLHRTIENYDFLQRAQREGWDVFRVSNWEGMVAFARDFSRRQYAQEDET